MIDFLFQERHRAFSKILLPPLNVPTSYLVTTAVLQFESSLNVSILLKSCEIQSSSCNILDIRDGVGEIHTVGLSCCSSGMSFFFFFSNLFCISKLLASKDRRSLDQWKLCGMGGINPPSLSFFLFCMYFRCSDEWSQRGAATEPYRWMLFNISCVHQKVCVWVRALKEGAALQGVQ